MMEFLLGLGVGAAAMYGWQKYGHELGSGGGYSHASGQAKLRGHLVPSTVGSPAKGLLVPQAGYATRADFEWGYLVGAGDTAGDIAEAITGDDGRYQELLLANPHVKTVGTPGVFLGEKAWNFAPGALVEGEGLLLPIPWSAYVDQTGTPRGQKVPFPSDPRESSIAGMAPTGTALAATSAPGTLTAGMGTGVAPYDAPFAMPAMEAA